MIHLLNLFINVFPFFLGEPIAKGCAAVVYTASLKDPEKFNSTIPTTSASSSSAQDDPIQYMSPRTNNSPIPHYRNSFSGSLDNIYMSSGNASNFDGYFPLRDRLNSATFAQPTRGRFASISEDDFIPIESTGDQLSGLDRSGAVKNVNVL